MNTNLIKTFDMRFDVLCISYTFNGFNYFNWVLRRFDNLLEAKVHSNHIVCHYRTLWNVFPHCWHSVIVSVLYETVSNTPGLDWRSCRRNNAQPCCSFCISILGTGIDTNIWSMAIVLFCITCVRRTNLCMTRKKLLIQT